MIDLIPIEASSVHPKRMSLGSDEYRCLKCNKVWSRDEDEPPCGVQ